MNKIGLTTEEAIEKLRYKAENIKAHIEPEFFNEVADTLETLNELQKAKKPIVWANGTKRCPNCELDNSALRFNVCIECGQKLLWGDD